MFEYVENKQLKNEIKKILIDCNITNKEVAEKMGITPQTYQRAYWKRYGVNQERQPELQQEFEKQQPESIVQYYYINVDNFTVQMR